MANDFMKMLQQQMTDDSFISQLSEQLGGVEKEKAAAAASGAASILTGALAKNTASKEGASSLASALDRDHDGSVLDDLMGTLTGAVQSGGGRALNSSGILSHILGSRQSGAADLVSKMSGLDKGKTSQLMMMMAPVVMGMLGKAKRQNGLDASGLSSILSGAFGQQKGTANQAMSMISGFLDQDGDGDITDDLSNLGKGLLDSLFGRR